MRFQTPELFARHVVESHFTSITEQQLPILVEMSERQMDGMEIMACPLCPDERRLMSLQAHIAGHLESIALFVLLDEADQDCGGGSQQAADGRTSSNPDDPSSDDPEAEEKWQVESDDGKEIQARRAYFNECV